MQPTLRSSAPWWQDGVVYQVYLRSFADADGDGRGDLAGLEAHLDHIAALGVDGIWLNPCYPSPQRDHGYDIADYMDVEPAYGTLAGFDRLLDAAHSRGLRVLLDLVPNHCSSEHPWFRAALTAAPDSPERARFHFRDGRGHDGSEPPNNWQSIFGGPAWTRVTEPDGTPGQWYLHIFDSSQPDFDWANPEVVAYFDEVLRFWFDRGVDGMRIDVAHGMAKHPELADWPTHEDGSSNYNAHMFNRPDVHEIHRRWRALADSYGPERALTLVGEVWVPSAVDLALYLRPDELPQAFFFDLLASPWRAKEFRTAIDGGLHDVAASGATVTWTLSNHDVHRTVTRLGQSELGSTNTGDLINLARSRAAVDVPLGERRARAALMLMLALPGAAYLYQGEELGLPEVMDLPDAARQDPIFLRSAGSEFGRDGCRVPLPWTTDAATSYGFSPDDGGAPWLPQPEWFESYAVSRQAGDPQSMLSLYRAALRLRRGHFAGDLDWDDSLGRDDVLVFVRGDARSVVTFGDDPVELPESWGTVALSSAPLDGRQLPGDAAAWLTTA